MNNPQKTDLSLYDNSFYQPGKILKRVSWLIVSSLFFTHSLAIFNGFKCTLIRWFGGKVGKGVLIKPSVSIKYPWFLSIGDFVWIGENVWIDNLTHTFIGNNVCLSQGAMILTGNHNYSLPTFDLMVKPVVLEDGVWVGAKSIVCPGVTCKTHSVLTVNSVASKNLEPYTVNSGNPAVEVKKRQIDS